MTSKVALGGWMFKFWGIPDTDESKAWASSGHLATEFCMNRLGIAVSSIARAHLWPSSRLIRSVLSLPIFTMLKKNLFRAKSRSNFISLHLFALRAWMHHREEWVSYFKIQEYKADDSENTLISMNKARNMLVYTISKENYLFLFQSQFYNKITAVSVWDYLCGKAIPINKCPRKKIIEKRGAAMGDAYF